MQIGKFKGAELRSSLPLSTSYAVIQLHPIESRLDVHAHLSPVLAGQERIVADEHLKNVQ